MSVTVILRKQEHILPQAPTVKRAMELMDVIPETYLAVRDGELLTEDDRLNDGDVIRLIPVISGGNQ
ncbi:MAG TPA: MoaD/ThiS family protein [Anaerolineaceae bacterium]|jgi:sulfur carrier protein ThiS|nr:MoaD/ThiS family protein [Anaerolineaceae bacterium]